MLTASSPRPFDDFYREYYVRVLVLMRRHFPGCDAEDVAQETMARCYTRFDAFDPDRDPWPWVASVARNTAIDAIRRTRRLAIVAEVGETAAASTDAPHDATYDALLHRERRRSLAHAMGRLKPADRQLIEDHDLEGIACAEIAAVRDLTPNALRQRLHRARRRLAVELQRTGAAFGVVGVALHQRFARVARRLNDVGMATGTASEAALGLVAAVAVTSSVVAGLAIVPAGRSTPLASSRPAATVAASRLSGGAGLSPRDVAAAKAAAVRTARPAAHSGAHPAIQQPVGNTTVPVRMGHTGDPTKPEPNHEYLIVETPVGPVGVDAYNERSPGWGVVCYLGLVPC